MPTVKRVIRHVDVDIARGERRCRRDANHTIRPGSRCLTIQEPGTPFKRSYCAECALPILKQCAMDLRSIRDALYPNGVPVQHSPIKAAATLGETLVEKNKAAFQSRLQERTRPSVPVNVPTDSNSVELRSDEAAKPSHADTYVSRPKRAAGQ